MNREILFRAKRSDTGEWVEGSLIVDYHIIQGSSCRIVTETGPYEWVQVDPATIGQFTGLLDKNGKKAFDGDITDDGIIVWHPDYLGFFIDYGEEVDERWKPLFDIPFFEIIGTIHDK